jgi:magnesium transporter
MRVLRLEKGTVVQGGRALAGPGASVWLDLTPSPENLAFLGERFRFHPLALEDCAHEDQRVKFEQYGDDLFMVVHRMMPAADDSEIVPMELHVFLTPDALVTVHSAPIAEVDHVFQRCATEPGLLARGPDFALYLVYDELADVHFALVDALSSEVEELSPTRCWRARIRPGRPTSSTASSWRAGVSRSSASGSPRSARCSPPWPAPGWSR